LRLQQQNKRSGFCLKENSTSAKLLTAILIEKGVPANFADGGATVFRGDGFQRLSRWRSLTG